MMRNDTGNKAALVLSGGGAYGAYEIGVIKALFEGKSPSTAGVALEPDIFVGTSVGGFNAAILAMNKGGSNAAIKDLESLWMDKIADKDDGRGNGVYRIRGNPLDYIDPRSPGAPMAHLERLLVDTTALGKAALPRVLNFLSPAGRLLDRVEGLVDISVFLNVDPFCHLVKSAIEPATLRKSGKVLRVMATSWMTGDAQEFDFPRMTDEETWAAIRASAAIPGLFPPVKLWDETFIDGGVVQNTPIHPAIEECADEIHVVSLNPNFAQMPETHIDNTLDTFTRVYSAMMSSNIAEDVESARWVNDGIDVMERMEAGEEVNTGTMLRFAKVAGVIHRKLLKDGQLPRKLTIHRYYPGEYLGDMLGMLNFHRGAIEDMIAEGYANTCTHDCVASGCVLTTGTSAVAELVRSAGE
jgi:NTE family protein